MAELLRTDLTDGILCDIGMPDSRLHWCAEMGFERAFRSLTCQGTMLFLLFGKFHLYTEHINSVRNRTLQDPGRRLGVTTTN